MPDYGSATAVKQMLGPDATVYSADDDARIAALLKMASRTVEQETGAAFGDGATAVREGCGCDSASCRYFSKSGNYENIQIRIQSPYYKNSARG